jgi:hypothetical protein
METLLGESDASCPLQWWGYARADGEIILRRFRCMAEVERLADDAEVPYVRGPFIAFGRGAAMAKLREKIATARVKDAQRRREAAALINVSYSEPPYVEKTDT